MRKHSALVAAGFSAFLSVSMLVAPIPAHAQSEAEILAVEAACKGGGDCAAAVAAFLAAYPNNNAALVALAKVLGSGVAQMAPAVQQVVAAALETIAAAATDPTVVAQIEAAAVSVASGQEPAPIADPPPATPAPPAPPAPPEAPPAGGGGGGDGGGSASPG